MAFDSVGYESFFRYEVKDDTLFFWTILQVSPTYFLNNMTITLFNKIFFYNHNITVNKPEYLLIVATDLPHTFPTSLSVILHFSSNTYVLIPNSISYSYIIFRFLNIIQFFIN